MEAKEILSGENLNRPQSGENLDGGDLQAKMKDIAVMNRASTNLGKDQKNSDKKGTKTKDELEFDSNTSAETRSNRFDENSGVIEVVREGSGRRSKIQGFSQVLQANQKAKEKEISESLERNVDKTISMKDKLQVKKMG